MQYRHQKTLPITSSTLNHGQKLKELASFYFEAFDEPWKAFNGEGPQGAHWGIWDNKVILKPGMRAVFDGETIADNWSGNQIIGGPGNPAISFTYVPPIWQL